MPISNKPFAAIALVLLFVLGCGVKEQVARKTEDAKVKSDAQNLIEQAESRDASEIDLSQEMDSVLGKEMQVFARSIQRAERDLVQKLDAFNSQNFLGAKSLSEAAIRNENRQKIDSFRSYLKEHEAVVKEYWDGIYELLKKYYGEDAIDPSAILRFGFSAKIDALEEHARVKREIIDYAEETKPTIGGSGELEFATSSQSAKFDGLVIELINAKVQAAQAAEVFDQMRRTQLEYAQEMVGD